jgi:hypothetical protein
VTITERHSGILMRYAQYTFMQRTPPRHLAKPADPRRGRSRHSTSAGITIVVLLVAGTIFGMSALRERDRPGRSDTQATSPEPPAPVVPSVPATSRPAGPAGPDNLVPNSGFEADLRGWRALGGADLTREPGGKEGGWDVRVAPGQAGGTTPGLSLPTVVRSKPGQLYHANGWVRSARPGAVLTIALYERLDGRRARANVLGMTLPDTAWHQFGTLHQTALPGSDLTFEIAARQLPEGAWFEVDQVLVHEL